MPIEEDLHHLIESGLARTLFPLPHGGGKFVFDGRNCLNFSSNDYLGLSHDPRVKSAAIKAIESTGCGSTGSGVMCGYLNLHRRLEDQLIHWLGYEEALIFGSGFLANLGVLGACIKPDDLVFFDRLIHASLVDGILSSGAQWKRFQHNSIDELKKLLEFAKNQNKRIFVVVESIYSMDGDCALLSEIGQLARTYGAFLVVDEAHALGVFGNKGSGLCSEKNVRPDIITGNFSKALGNYGGFAVCSSTVKKWLVSKARTFMYSTALPPPCLGGALGALEIIKSEPTLGETLIENARSFHHMLTEAGLQCLPTQSQIVPLMVGDNAVAMGLAESLWEKGIYVKAIRPPTVPQGTARLRFSITLTHSREDLDRAAQIIVKTSKAMQLL